MEDNQTFSSFGLSAGVLEALARKGFTAPSSIQIIALPRLLADQGHLVVKARTGTGKTAAFGIPLVEKLTQNGYNPGRAPRALILTPTRELALQVAREIASFVPAGTAGGAGNPGPFPRITAVYGGASIRNQIIDLKRGTEIVVGTPGRIMDLMDRKVLDLSAIDWFILDEADEMLDMGFFEDVEKILGAVKSDRRVALFSATMPEAILKVIRQHIGEVEILQDAAAEDEKPAVDQFYMVLKKEDRLEALRRVIDSAEDFYGLIFCATKAGTDELARRLLEGGYPAEAIHGDLSQEARERTLRRFRAKQTTILVATDVAARGIDVERLTHVINYDLPNDRETYVHRIGRTGRAGRRGRAISLALPAERGRIGHLSASMERTLGSRIEWMRLPPVKAVMKAQRERILASILAAVPVSMDDAPIPEVPVSENAQPDQFANQSDRGLAEITEQSAQLPAEHPAQLPADTLSPMSRILIDRLGAEGAVEALVTVAYGELLDPARYGPVTEIPETVSRDSGGRKGPLPRGGKFEGRPPVHGGGRFEGRPPAHGSVRPRNGGREAWGGEARVSRVYVGVGRHHGASARNIAEILGRAGGVPGRLVDAIEMKEFCAFATLPEDAARRACAFSRSSPEDPVIKPASPSREERPRHRYAGSNSLGSRLPAPSVLAAIRGGHIRRGGGVRGVLVGADDFAVLPGDRFPKQYYFGLPADACGGCRLYQAFHVNHGGNQGGGTDDAIGLFRDCGPDKVIPRNAGSQVYDPEPPAFQHNSDDVFLRVLHITFNRTDNHGPRRRRGGGGNRPFDLFESPIHGAQGLADFGKQDFLPPVAFLRRAYPGD
jgi:ATP-dependent RNA helicase DeaD